MAQGARGLPDQGADRLSDRGICVESSGKTAVDLSKDGLAIEPDGVIVTAADSDGERRLPDGTRRPMRKETFRA